MVKDKKSRFADCVVGSDYFNTSKKVIPTETDSSKNARRLERHLDRVIDDSGQVWADGEIQDSKKRKSRKDGGITLFATKRIKLKCSDKKSKSSKKSAKTLKE